MTPSSHESKAKTIVSPAVSVCVLLISPDSVTLPLALQGDVVGAIGAASPGCEPGVIAERITYGTRFGLRIPVVLYMPEQRSGRIPALIVVNGHGGDKYSWYAFYTGILYARGGAAVLTYDPLGEGERNPERKSGTRAHDKLEPVREIALQVSGQMIGDVQQAVLYLSSRPEIDSRRIGAPPGPTRS